jgi:RNA polymerase sigma factor (sigma-70 family)
MHTDDTALYEACQREGSGDQADAFGTIWRQFYRIAHAMLRVQPDADALATDCAQLALIKLHQRLDTCANPAAFRAWANQIVRRTVLDELRRPERARRVPLPDDHDEAAAWLAAPPDAPPPDDLRALLRDAVERGPLSPRSRRVVIGRYFDDRPDETLAALESALGAGGVLPSHIQVTRAKDLAALRRDAALLDRLRDFVD